MPQLCRDPWVGHEVEPARVLLELPVDGDLGVDAELGILPRLDDRDARTG